MIDTFHFIRLLNLILVKIFQKNICIFAKNRYLFGRDIGKINICGVILETWCHLEIRVFSSSWKRWLFEEFWDFRMHENGFALGAFAHGSVRFWLAGGIDPENFRKREK